MSTSSEAYTRRAKATYHPKGYGVSEGLARARRPFRTSNAITGGLITAFAFSVYIYSIRAVKQDDFSDVVLPESVGDRSSIKSIEDEERERLALKEGLKREFLEGPGTAPTTTEVVQTRQVGARSAWWSALSERFVKEGPLVAGAPPLNQLGKVEFKGTEGGRKLV
ncbi:Coiled-coil domain-containing protein 56 [Pseudohyphozyma bogoriensis]|nr:Coiled-coil domain-containing protein 56 [Pseudohyphozyma bogoriensis]